MTARRIALLGAASTGKTWLSQELAAQLRLQGLRVAVVAGVLREWCAHAGRAPRPGEQLPIAREQERRVDAAATGHDVVIADTTALMVAIHGGMRLEDAPLYRFALERQRAYDTTLVTGLDLPWVADGLQREGPHARAQVDRLVRAALQRAGVGFQVIYGVGPARRDSALAALAGAGIARAQANRTSEGAGKAWLWNCEKCSDPDCEHRLFSRLR